jgi:hypothetical protein
MGYSDQGGVEAVQLLPHVHCTAAVQALYRVAGLDPGSRRQAAQEMEHNRVHALQQLTASNSLDRSTRSSPCAFSTIAQQVASGVIQRAPP